MSIMIGGINFDRTPSYPYYAPAMVNLLADVVRPAELANRCQVIEFKITIGDCLRIVEIIEKDLVGLAKKDQPIDWKAAPVEGRLEFSSIGGENELPAVQGYVCATIAMVCQRCLESFEMPLETPISAVFSDSVSVGDLEKVSRFDIWELDASAICLLDIIEESIVMDLPLAPLHDSIESCGALETQVPAATLRVAGPFADLRSQMDKLNK